MKQKILFGVCGIGLGHTLRQLPIIEYFAATSRVVLFAYGASLKFYSAHFAQSSAVTIVPVSVPFYVGGQDGIDFVATAKREIESGQNHLPINCAALAKAKAVLDRPDIVITDYEPVSAQYAYACGVPLVTIDQQSKYLVGDFPPKLGGQGYKDEMERLRMFFPKADLRIACSFFQVVEKAPETAIEVLKGKVPKEASESLPANVFDKTPATEQVMIVPPILNRSIVSMQRQPSPSGKSLLVYLSSQREFMQELAEVVAICASQSDCSFQIFLPELDASLPASSNILMFKHGDPQFVEALKTCNGMITTGGHSLLSEAMHLGIPAYVIPLAVYEQQMNAHIIDKHGFGISRSRLTKHDLPEFINTMSSFAEAIADDTHILLRGSGERSVIQTLTERFFD